MTNSLNNILVTGGEGQVALALRQVFPSAIFLSKNEWDILDPVITERMLKHYRPAFVINTAAYTQVDKAESERAKAEAINHFATKQLAIACEHYRVPLIHLSTDYVFQGNGTTPYAEDDEVNPINFYGLTKWRGEEAVRMHCENAIILRVSGVFSEHKHNFLKTMIKLSEQRDELRIVNDQIICPTYAGDIALTIKKLMERSFVSGTYHFCNDTALSWHAFTVMIMRALQSSIAVIPISSAEYNTAAKRPSYSVLNCEKIKKIYGITQPSLTSAIQSSLMRLSHA